MIPAKRFHKSVPTENMDTDSITECTISDVNVEFLYDLDESDWVYLSDYLNPSRILLLYCLSSASYLSSWCINLQSLGTSWVLLLHVVDAGVQTLVIGKVQHGTYQNKDIQILI